MKKPITLILVVFTLSMLSFTGFAYAYQEIFPSFEKLNPEKKHAVLIDQRDTAIAEAVQNGDYDCCINPPCTMCYMEANKWNNFKPGTCACDEMIEKGEDPCPQCKNGLCEKSEEGVCKVNEK